MWLLLAGLLVGEAEAGKCKDSAKIVSGYYTEVTYFSHSTLLAEEEAAARIAMRPMDPTKAPANGLVYARWGRGTLERAKPEWFEAVVHSGDVEVLRYSPPTHAIPAVVAMWGWSESMIFELPTAPPVHVSVIDKMDNRRFVWTISAEGCVKRVGFYE